jgi:hypothetical protein
MEKKSDSQKKSLKIVKGVNQPSLINVNAIKNLNIKTQVTAFYYDEGEKMIVIFPLLVSKNVNTNLVQGLAVTLERYIAAYAISDFVGKQKEFNKYYNYKMKGGQIYKESDSTWFDLDPLTRSILDEQESLSEIICEADRNPATPNKKGVSGSSKSPYVDTDPLSKESKRGIKVGADIAQNVGKALQDLKGNKDPKTGQPVPKPTFSSASISNTSLNLEPTWVSVKSSDGVESQLGIKVIPMMIEGFNIKHTLSVDIQKYMISSFMAGIGRKVMRLIYRVLDKWTAFGSRPRGDIRHDVFYARTGHDGQPFILLDKNEDVPKYFFTQPQNMLKLWKMSWGNLLVADDLNKTVMFCMKKYKGMCSNFTYSMIFAQTKEMGRVFEDMESARKATGALFKMNKKITSLGGK